jgi:hypothetical protein
MLDAEERGYWLGARCRIQSRDLSIRLIAVDAYHTPAP